MLVPEEIKQDVSDPLLTKKSAETALNDDTAPTIRYHPCDTFT